VIHILGAGALGCLWAAKLSQVTDVSFIESPRRSQTIVGSKDYIFQNSVPKCKTLKSDTLQNHEHSDRQTLSIPRVRPFEHSKQENFASINTLLLTTKSYDALSALSDIRQHLNPQTQVVLFQNGLGSQQKILKYYSDIAIYAAVTTEGVNMTDSKTVVHAGKGKTVFGALNDTAHSNHARSDQAHIQNSFLLNNDLETDFHENIWETLWLKLAINCAINPFTALEDCNNGTILSRPLFLRLWPALRAELTELLILNGIRINESGLEAKVFEVIKLTQYNISSMLQDIRHGKQSEIDDINGFVSTALAAKNRPHKTNLMLWEKVRALGN